MIKQLAFALALCTIAAVQGHAAEERPERRPTQVEFASGPPVTGDLVLGVYANGQLGPLGNAIDDKTGGALASAINALAFDAEVSETQLIAGPAGSGYERILLIGLGGQEEAKSALQWQEIGGNAAQAAIEALGTLPPMAFDASASHVADLAYGAKLGSYYFDKYISDQARRKSQTSLLLVTPEAGEVREQYVGTLDPVANGIWYARDVSNEPANVIYPESFVDTWKDHFKQLANVKVSVFDEQDMRKRGMGAIYGVGQGSTRPPRMLVVEYLGGAADDAPVVIVGKGITFDTGGISIKASMNMWNMKFDMSGAASAMGALYALAGRKAAVNVIGIAALAENMPSGAAQRPGDIVSTLSGKRIEIRNTDAEGRLVLADALHYGDITYDPVLLVDIATLTGSARRALGHNYAALLTRHAELVPGFAAAGEVSGERVWRMPLEEDHFEAIESTVADVVNSAEKGPGLSTAAAFLASFVRETTPWVHFDIAGVAYSDEPAPLKGSPGSAAFGVGLLNAYISERFENR